MTTATAEKTQPQSTLTDKVGTTGTLPLKGKLTSGKVKDLTGKTIKQAPDPKVYKAAEEFAVALDSVKTAVELANQKGAALSGAFKSTKKGRYVRVVTDKRTWVFKTETKTKLVKEVLDQLH